MKKVAVIILFHLQIMATYGQAPKIFSVTPKSTYLQDRVSISGTNFGTDINDVKVFFGAAAGTIVSIADNLLDVAVPVGSTFDYITVTVLSSGLTAFAPIPFYISYGGSAFDPALFDAQLDFPADLELNDLCICDFDADDKPDIAGANNNSSLITILRNISTASNINFSGTSVNLNTPTLNTVCGDLDGDGKPDLVFSKGGGVNDRVLVLRNTSSPGSISFAAAQPFTIAGNNAKRIAINDLNKDGKPELVVTNESNNLVTILENQSTPGSIGFNTSMVTIQATNSSTTSGLAIGDINNDNFPDIVVNSPFGADLTLFVNTGNSSQISFENAMVIPVPGNLVNVKIGDLNKDGWLDIAATQLVTDKVSVILNQSTDAGNIQFSGAVDFSAPLTPWGIDFGDVNGDQKPDIIIGSIDNSNQIGILENTSVSSTPAFTFHALNTLGKNRNLKVGDVSGDGKPDIVFTSIDNNNISVFRNKNCLEAILNPNNDTTICSGQSMQLASPVGLGASYAWTKDSAPLPDITPSITVNSTGAYQLEITSESGACVSQSSVVNVTVLAGTVPSLPASSNDGPVCANTTLNLSATSTNATSYVWKGPNGFESFDQNPSLSNFQINQAGRYMVWGVNGSCFSDPAETIVEVIELPDASVTTNDPTEFCSGKSALLELNPEAGNTYQWQKNGVDLAGETGVSITVGTTGDYTVNVTNAQSCVISSETISITELTLPVAGFNAPGSGCINQVISFDNNSTVTPGPAILYDWDFGDGTVSTDINPAHTYSTDGNYTVTLTVSYLSDPGCTDTFQKAIIINPPPTFGITANGNTSVCLGDSVKLTAEPGFDAYLWSTGEADSVIYAKNSGTYTVEVTDANGCSSQESVDITNFSQPVINVSADSSTIIRGDSVQLTATGANVYNWTPGVSLNDSTINNPIAKPDTTTTYVVTGEDMNGCLGNESVTITVNQEPRITALDITAPKLFSPNNDGIDDVWVIEGIEKYPDCTLLIFNRQGSLLYEAKAYQNDWNATYKGRELPEDVYYFVIRCDGTDRNVNTGSVTVLRGY